MTLGVEKLFIRGELPSGGVAIIGSRTPPPSAARFAYSLASRLREPVIAGLALGIDAAAHRGSMVAGMPTVAFVGYGFGCTFPPEHAALEEAIVVSGGAIATLYPPETAVSDSALIERDRLQAEFARAVVLVCSEPNGGAMHTMRFASELGKPRFAVAPPAGSEDVAAWGGNRICIEEGATPLPFDVDAALAALSGSL
ncbi:MAG: DNA-processing protein DprA [Candidatus Eremiobacteraeota bacterium]|nr:DNA-processing protein DprA [Candidatus Eremiobacteraeota bacterium]MBV9263450.1 DNA-processing protein DprA [Candidatus Eremiobacteraeota bacterium]